MKKTFTVTYDQSLSLWKLIRRAVGPRNINNISQHITSERFLLATGIGVRQANFRVKPYLKKETSEQAAARLMSAGHKLGDTGALAGFLHDHPEEVNRWGWVFAISKDSRYVISGGLVCVPCVSVDGTTIRHFELVGFRRTFGSFCGALVESE